MNYTCKSEIMLTSRHSWRVLIHTLLRLELLRLSIEGQTLFRCKERERDAGCLLIWRHSCWPKEDEGQQGITNKFTQSPHPPHPIAPDAASSRASPVVPLVPYSWGGRGGSCTQSPAGACWLVDACLPAAGCRCWDAVWCCLWLYI